METPDVIPTSISDDVQVRLNTLNEASTFINTYEVELDKCRHDYQLILAEATKNLSLHYKKSKNCIERARPFFALRSKRQQMLLDVQKHAELFKEYQTEYEATKSKFDTYDVEFATFNDSDESGLNQLNVAVEHINASKQKLSDLHFQHESLLSQCISVDDEIHLLKSNLSFWIKKAQPYFDLQAQYHERMEEAKTKVDTLIEKINSYKKIYASTMHSLEAISNSIHKARLVNGKRRQGVGADSNSGSFGDGTGVDSSPATESSSFHHSWRNHQRLPSDLSELLCSPRRTPPGQVDTDDEAENFQIRFFNGHELPLVEGLSDALHLSSTDDKFVNEETSGYASILTMPNETYASFDKFCELESLPKLSMTPPPSAVINHCRSRSL